MGSYCCQINILVYTLVIIWGISSWIDINGLWSELPFLVNILPEKWNLPSYMVIIIQLANIGPLVFSVAKLRCNKQIKEVPVIYVIIFVGAASTLLLAFFWDTTTYIAGVQHSTVLLVLNFFLALVDCTSSVVFLPFLAAFKPQYITALFIGEGFSGLLPSVVALGQGASRIKCVNVTLYHNETLKNGSVINVTEYKVFPEQEKPYFSTEIFFFFLFGMLVVSGIAFTLLNYLPSCKEEQDFQDFEKIVTTSENPKHVEINTGRYKSLLSSTEDRIGQLEEEVTEPQTASISEDQSNQTIVTVSDLNLPQEPYSQSVTVCFLLLTLWINGLTNGVLPTVQTFSVLPYGNSAYHLAVNLGNMANPLACFLTFFYQTRSLVIIFVLVFVGSSVGAFCMYLAVLSPFPLIARENGGDVMAIMAWVFVVFVMTYAKVSIAGLLHLRGKKGLLWCGIVTQIGSAIGATVMFLLVNVFSLFVQGSQCDNT